MVGDTVRCDACNKEWTDSPVSGGFLFDSYAYCPECAVNKLPRIKSYNEESHIKEWCPPNLSYADWVRKMRWASGVENVTIVTWE